MFKVKEPGSIDESGNYMICLEQGASRGSPCFRGEILVITYCTIGGPSPDVEHTRYHL